MSNDAPMPVRQQQLMEELAKWMVNALETEPGWDSLILELKPSADSMLMRITQHAGSASASRHGELQPDSDPCKAAWELRKITSDTPAGPWNSAAIHVNATDWPQPRFDLDAFFNHEAPAPDFDSEDVPSGEVDTHDGAVSESPIDGSGLVAEAVAAFATRSDLQAAINVARQCVGAELLLDITEAPDRPSINVVEADGVPSLLVFTSQAELATFRASMKRPGDATSWIQDGEALLRFVDLHAEIEAIRINPAGPSCALGRREIGFVIGSLVNPALKVAASAAQPEASVIRVLREPGAKVILADKVGGGGPLVMAGPDGSPVLPVFSAGAEVAAFDSSLSFTEVSAEWVLSTVAESTNRSIVVNPAGPSVMLHRDALSKS